MKTIEILLVEDSAGDILLIRQALTRERFPISIHAAVDGEQAMQILEARQFEPDLVVLDLNLPKFPGLSFLARYRSDAPVVVFTVSSNPEHRRRALELGAKEYFEKPIDLEEYQRVVHQIVQNWAASDDQTPVAT